MKPDPPTQKPAKSPPLPERRVPPRPRNPGHLRRADRRVVFDPSRKPACSSSGPLADVYSAVDNFTKALAALVGRDASGLSAATIGRLKEILADEHARWLKRDLLAKQYVYLWVHGIHVQARLEDEAQCILVIIGATGFCVFIVLSIGFVVGGRPNPSLSE